MNAKMVWLRSKGKSISVGVLLSSAFVLGFTSCKGSSASFNAPALAPIVNGSLPATLQSSTTTSALEITKERVLHNPANVLTDWAKMPHDRTYPVPAKVLQNRAPFVPDNLPSGEMTNAIAFIKALFSNYYVSPNDGKGYQGYVNSLVVGVDGRMSGINAQISGNGNTPACLSAAMQATPLAVGLGAIDPMVNFSAPYLQCNNVFTVGGGNVAGAGSGAAFGQSGSNFSLWLLLVAGGSPSATTFDQTGGFLGVANVINAGSTAASAPETVDGMLLSYTPLSTNSGNQITVSRFTASRTTTSFALFVGSNQTNQPGFKGTDVSSGNGTDTMLGAGFRLISDGTHVYSDGILLDTGNSNYYFYDVCLNASDLSLDTTPADCTSLANDYVTTAWATLYPGLSTNPNPLATTASLNVNEVTGCTGTTTLPTHGSGGLAVSTGSTTACQATPPGNAISANMTAPQTAVTTALKTVALPVGLTDLSQ